MPFGERSEKLSKVMERYRCDDLWIVPTTPCRRRSDLDAAYEGYLAAEFEGQVIRLDLPYHHGRTRAMLKRKPGEGA
jgi:ATP-dependent DNA ligase